MTRKQYQKILIQRAKELDMILKNKLQEWDTNHHCRMTRPEAD
jgi:hypothetical protein